MHHEEFAGTSRFRVLAKLGAGGMGVVYRAYDHQQGRDVALKTLQRFDATRLYRFKREFRALADVAHPNLVSLYELLGERNSWFFTMELLDAVEFRAWTGRPGATASGTCAGLRDITLPQRTPSLPGAGLEIRPEHAAGGCDVERLRPTLRQLARGVDALHKAGWLHCDIKPSNVLVTNQGRVVLVDFGLVTESQPASARQSSGERLIGTPAYMSPEQAAGDPLGTMSDWYSVGVMLYEVLTGRLPFEGTMVDVLTSKQRAEPQPPSALAAVPADLDDLCMALLRRRPEDRPKGEEVMARLGEVVSKLAVAERSRARAPVFLGRIDELQALTDAYAAAREGTPVTLHVHGGSGMGKTALIARFLEQVRADPQATVLAGRCYERESMPYKALDSVVDDLSRHLHRLGGDAAGLMPRHVRSLVRLFPVLKRAEAVGRAPLPPIEIPDRQELRRRAFGALKELLARIADRGPVVLWIDDAQWGDVDSAALLTEMARPPDAPALLLVLSYRTEDRARSACLQMLQAASAGADSDVRELRVGPLLPADAQDLARALLPRADAGRAAQVAQEAEGNPLFVAELALHGTLERATLEEMLLSRVAQLPAGARDLLEVIAVASGPIEPVTALRAAEPTGDGLAALAVLRAGRLVRAAASGEQIETYHDRIRESVTLHLSTARLRECHAALARALQSRPGADPEALAVHLHAAGELVRAGEQAAAAARAAAEALAFDRAARLYRLALDVAPADASSRLRLQVELGTALANAGRGAQAAEIYLAAAANTREGQALDLRRRAAEQFLISGHVPQGLTALRVVVEGIGMRIAPTPRLALVRLLLARLRIRLRGLSSRERRPEEIDPDELMRIDVCRSAAIGLSMIDTIRGAEFQSRYALLALRSGEPSRIASALSLEGGHVASIGGRRAERMAERILGRAESLAQRSGQPYPLALLEFARGAADFLNGRWKLSVERCDSAAEVFRDRCTGAAWETDTSCWFAASARFYLGQFRELGRRLTLLVDEARARGDLYASTLFSTLLAQSALVAADQAERARATLERARAEWNAEGFHIQHYWMLLGEGFIDLYDGQGRRAFERVQASWPAFAASQLPRVGMVEAQLLHLRGAAALAAATGTEDAAEAAGLLEIADRAAGALMRGRIVPFRSIGLLLRAGVCSAGKRPERAASMFQEAAQRLEEVGMTLYAAAARRRWAEVIGGKTGRDGLRAADGSMAAEGICNPARMTQMLAPGRGPAAAS